MPIDENALSVLVDAARLSTPELERIAQSVLGSSVTSVSDSSTPAEQARDMVTYAKQYGLLRQLAAEIISTGSDRAGLQNLLLGNYDMINPSEGGQRDSQRIDMIRLEDRVSRNSDKFDALAVKVEALAVKVETLGVRVEVLTTKVEHLAAKVEALGVKIETLGQHPPLNWNIIAWGIVLAILAGVAMWTMAVTAQ